MAVHQWTPGEERPLTARSVIASTLLGVRPPRLRTSLLVRSCGLFGIRPGTARVAISRMVAAGELATDGDGYRLGGGLRLRQDRQELSRRAATRRWRADRDGWAMAVVAVENRAAPDRSALRRAALALRLAELREGVWMRPDNLRSGGLPDAELVVAGQCDLFMSVRPGEADDPALAARLWDLTGWADRAVALEHAFDASEPALGAGDRAALPHAFVLSAAVLRHLQADPLLPDALLPDDWPGAGLRRTYGSWSEAFDRVWADWYRAERGD